MRGIQTNPQNKNHQYIYLYYQEGIPATIAVRLENLKPQKSSESVTGLILFLEAEELISGTEEPIFGSGEPILGTEKRILGTGEPILEAEKSILGAEKPILRTEKPILGAEKMLKTAKFHQF